MSWLLLSLLQKPSPEGMVDHSGHVLDCKQTVEFLCGEHQNRMNGYHTAIQLLLRALVRLCWLTQIQLQTSWLPGRFTMKSSYVRWRVSGRKPRLMNGRQMLTSTICACFMMGSRGGYGPKQNMTMLIITREKNVLITDCQGIRAQHFQYLFSKSTTTSKNVLDSLLRRLGWATSYSQISNTVASMQGDKQYHFFKHRMPAARLCLNDCTIFFCQIWDAGITPQYFKDRYIIERWKERNLTESNLTTGLH